VKRAALAVLLFCSQALAEPGDAFRAAQGNIDALEKLGAERPTSVWTDDAWTEAAQLAERQHDLARAKRDLEQAIAISTDPVLSGALQSALSTTRDEVFDTAGPPVT